MGLDSVETRVGFEAGGAEGFDGGRFRGNLFHSLNVLNVFR